MISRQFFIYALAACAAAYSFFMIAFTWHQLIDVFRLADPTGLFGFMMQVGGFVSNICVLLIAGLVALSAKKELLVPYKVCLLIFGIKLLEGLSLSPCAIGWGEAFCGMWWVLLSNLTSPILIAVTFIFLFTSERKILTHTAMVMIGSIAVTGVALFFLLTPKTAPSCMALDTITARAACLEKFALRDHDVTICRQIEFRSTRFNCLYNVARDTEDPGICEEISDPPGTKIAAYETPSSATKDLCYYLMGFKMSSQEMCQKVDDDKMRETCMRGIDSAPQ